MDRGAWWAIVPGAAELDKTEMTEHTPIYLFIYYLLLLSKEKRKENEGGVVEKELRTSQPDLSNQELII